MNPTPRAERHFPSLVPKLCLGMTCSRSSTSRAPARERSAASGKRAFPSETWERVRNKSGDGVWWNFRCRRMRCSRVVNCHRTTRIPSTASSSPRQRSKDCKWSPRMELFPHTGLHCCGEWPPPGCRHIANPNKLEHPHHIHDILGLHTPILATPFQLLEAEK